MSHSEASDSKIPSGWPLSATLALFRNLPLMESENFPKSSGDVYFSHDEQFQDGQTQVYTNTYQFYRKTDAGGFFALSIVEKHEMGVGADGAFYHRVSDVSRSLGNVNSLPGKAKKLDELSKLLGYIFDHREALLKSEAGKIAKELNYGPGGRLRPQDYSQPRVSFQRDRGGNVEKIQVFGLSSLLSEEQPISSKFSQESQVLEISMDQSGAAKVSVTAP